MKKNSRISFPVGVLFAVRKVFRKLLPDSTKACFLGAGQLMQGRRIVRMSILALARLAAVDYRMNSPLIFGLCLVVVRGIFVGIIQCRAPGIAGELSVP